MSSKNRDILLNNVLCAFTILLGLFGIYSLYFFLSVFNIKDFEIGEGFGTLAMIVFSFIGLIVGAIILGIAMEHELKNRKLTIIPVVLFVSSIVLVFI